MTNKVKYPIEAFALAMVLFTTSTKVALMMAIALVVVDVVASVLQGKMSNKVTAVIAGILAAAAVVGVASINGLELGLSVIISAIATGALMGKHYFEEEEVESSIVADVIAAVAFVVLALVREFLSTGAVFGGEGADLAFVSDSYGKAMFGLIGAALAIALVNKIVKTNGKDCAGLCTGMAAIVSAAPFTMKAFGEVGGQVVAMAMVAVMFYTFRNKLVFSNAEETTQGLPLDLALLGIIYMIVTIF